jgi:hypothetical protein
MADRLPHGTSKDALVVSETFAAARELLRVAEEDAARIRAEADRYMRQREQEAELLVGKARRLLAMAEQRAITIATEPDDVVHTVDLDAAAEAPPTLEDEEERPRRERVPSGLDGILASAIAKAVDRSFPVER